MDADFNDPKLKVLVKDHKFVCYNKDFRVIKLKEVRNVDVRRQKTKAVLPMPLILHLAGIRM